MELYQDGTRLTFAGRSLEEAGWQALHFFRELKFIYTTDALVLD